MRARLRAWRRASRRSTEWISGSRSASAEPPRGAAPSTRVSSSICCTRRACRPPSKGVSSHAREGPQHSGSSRRAQWSLWRQLVKLNARFSETYREEANPVTRDEVLRQYVVLKQAIAERVTIDRASSAVAGVLKGP